MIFTAAFAYYLFSRTTRHSIEATQGDLILHREKVQLIWRSLQTMFIKVLLFWPVYVLGGFKTVGGRARKLGLPIVLGLLIFCMFFGFIPVYLLVGFMFATYALIIFYIEAERVSNL